MNNWKGGFLYRYRRWDDYTKKLLLDGELYYACLHSLNDPNEGRNLSDTLIKSVLENDILPNAESSNEIKFIENEIKGFDHNSQISKKYKKVMLEHIKNMGVVCLTSKPDNNPMWHFYADESKGVCIEFYFPESYSSKYIHLCPCQIDYTNIEPTSENLAEILIFNKDKDWSYEEEFRLVSRNVDNESSRIHYFPVNKMLCSVIAGHKMDNDDFTELRKIIRQVNKKYNLKVTVHRRVNNDFGKVDIKSQDKWTKRHRGLKFLNAQKLE